MVNIAIVESDSCHLSRLEKILHNFSKELNMRFNIVSANNLVDYKREIYNKNIFDIYFLAIEIGNEKKAGIEIAKYIRTYSPYSAIVFITNLTTMMPLVFLNRLVVLDFIEKEQAEFEFTNRIKRCINYVLEKNNHITNVLNYSYQGRRGISIPFSDLFFIRTSKNAHRLIVYGHNFEKEFYGTISDILKLNNKKYLKKIDRATLVNVANILRIDTYNKKIIFKDGINFPVSKRTLRRLISELKHTD